MSSKPRLEAVREGRRTLPVEEKPSSSRSRNTGLLAGLSLIVCALFPNLLWIARDRTPWPWDQAWYGEVAVDLWFDLTHSFLNWGRSMLGGLNMKPPGIVWLGQLFVPFGSLFGSVEVALLFSVLITQGITLYLLFRIGRTIAPESYLVPGIGVCFAASTQSFIGFSHQFFVEPLQALAIVWILLIAVRCRGWTSARVVLHLTAALIAGLLAKATTPIYCFLPCLYIGFVLLHKPLRQGWQSECRSLGGRVLMFSICTIGPLAALWYSVNLKAVWRHVREASSGEIALNYGFRASVGRKLVVWLGLMDRSFLSPYLGWAAILAVVLALTARFFWSKKPSMAQEMKVVPALSALQ